MLRNLAFVICYAVILVLSTTTAVWAAEFGTAEEAKAMLERAVAAVKEDKAKALDMFNKGHPYLKGGHLQDIKGKKGFPLGQEIMQNATEGTIKEVTYWWPRPGSDKALEKTTFYTKVGDQNCGVGYYKE